MTRTERSISPRAIIKDRSESKSGMDKALRKGGAGGHNWGNINEEYLLEAEALDDQQQEPVANKGVYPATLSTSRHSPASLPEKSVDKPELTRRTSVTSEEDRSAAREVRKRALKDGVDLASIARSSVAVSSSF
ncbi:hypothetical protein BDM02DRAFT_1635491 [Thelephora ganbajun]|uniref:Uncharacterized protein n=1 Tax=Thelephora ganbajun TaxID=370292 RepID=A0ACB6ZW82_THEGA|nr:hypothetical protein BDM02DRAFT_1635491 [Thelephora ganbajun]